MHAAIIGAGLAGLVCARALAVRGVSVTVFDKGRAPGGRMCARRRAHGLHADHGARSFIVRDDRFARQTSAWLERGLVAEWSPALVAIDSPGAARELRHGPVRYVGAPAMHAPIRDIADSLGPRGEIRTGCRVTAIHRAAGAWIVETEGDQPETFDAVALAVPAPQAADLLTEIPHLHAIASAVPMSPCWAVSAVFRERLPIPFDAANVQVGGSDEHAGVLAWVSRESSKPGRPDDECWVLHAGEDWSRDHLEDDPAEVSEWMLDAFFSAAGVEAVNPDDLFVHRWRFAFPVAPLCDGCLFDEHLMLGACGDWCMGSRVEGAFLSGLAMASRLLGERSDFLDPCMANQPAR